MHLDAMARLPKAVDAGVTYVPGAPFYALQPRPDTLRLSFVTMPPDKSEAGVTAMQASFARPPTERPSPSGYGWPPVSR
jgi:DNA-binding transcriptional MocR family regulator